MDKEDEVNLIKNANNNNDNNNNSKDNDNNNNNTSSKTITIDQIIDDLGLHKYNILMLLITSFALFCDGIELYTVFLLLPVLKEKFDISDFQNSVIVSCSVLGSAVGVLVSGILTNKYGERKPFIIITLILGLFGSLTVVVDNYYWFCVCRLIVGICIGVIINYVNCLFENLPSKYRGVISIFIFSMIEIGILFYCFLFYYMSDKELLIDVYKKIVLISTIPMYVCFILALFFFEESPRKLFWNKKFDLFFDALNRYSGKKEYLTIEQKKELIDKAEKNEIMNNRIYNDNNFDSVDSADGNGTYWDKLRKVFGISPFDVCIQVVLWSVGIMIIFSSQYYLPKYLDYDSLIRTSNNRSNSNINIIGNQTQYNRNLSTNTSSILSFIQLNIDEADMLKNNITKIKDNDNIVNKLSLNNSLDFLKMQIYNNDSVILNTTSKHFNNTAMSDTHKQINLIQHIKTYKVEDRYIENANSNISDYNYKQRYLSENKQTDKPSNNSSSNYNAKHTPTNEVTIHTLSREKYLKIIKATLLSFIGELLGGLLSFTPIKLKHIITISYIVTVLLSFSKIYLLIFIEYISSFLKVSSKICLNFMRLYTSNHFHTKYRETVYSFCGFVSRFSILFTPFIIDFLFSLDIYYPTYFEITLGLLGLGLTLFIQIDDLGKNIDEVKIDKNDN